jgi:hypothetical protein
MLFLTLALMGSSAFEFQREEVAAFKDALLGKPPAAYQQYYRASGGVLSDEGGVTVYRWVERRGGTSMTRDNAYSTTALSYCQVEATVKDNAIIAVTVHGDTRRCRHMFAVMKRLS